MKQGGELDFLFNPRSIAVIGASPARGKLSAIVMESLDRAGFKGDIYPVNPKYRRVKGRKCYADIRDIGRRVDLAVVAVPAASAIKVIEGGGASMRAAVIIGGGFAETGEEGRKLEARLKAVAKSEGIRFIGPNCMGIYDTASRLDTLFISSDRVRRPAKGKIAILSQSGSFALTAMDEFVSAGIGVSKVVSYGNRADINEADCLDYIAGDASTSVVALYIEGIDEGRRFIDAAQRCVAAGKTVLGFKVGRRGAGAKAAGSHTGALAGVYEVYRAAFKKAGVVELAGYEEFVDGCRALSSHRPARGRRVMIITDGGGMGVDIADLCADAGLDVAALPEGKRRALKKLFPPYFTVGNPLDLTGSATDNWYAEALLRAMEGSAYDMTILTVLWGPPGLTDELARIVSGYAKKCGKPVIVCSPGGAFTKKKSALFEREGLPVFDTPEAAVRAASVLARSFKGG